MPAYSFQKRFVPYIQDGSKRQTIRSRRKHPAKPGDTLYLYYGLRTKHCRKLREEICTDARSIYISDFGIIIFSRMLTDPEIPVFQKKSLWGAAMFGHDSVDQSPLNVADIYLEIENPPEAFDRIAWRDGFRVTGSTENFPAGCFKLMLQWWRRTHELPFVGDIIYW